jgi:cytochrome c553
MPRYRNLSLVTAWVLFGVLFLTPCALAEAGTGQDAAGAEGSHATAGMLLTLLVVAVGLLSQYVVVVLVKKKQVSAAIPMALLGLVLFIVTGYLAYQETKSIVLGHGSADSPAAPVQVPAQEQTPSVLVPAGDLDPDAIYIAPAILAAGDTVLGRSSFDANCAVCHQTDGTGKAGMAPSIRNRDFLTLASD